ncbi:MAG: hypothetical protein AAF483_16105 [Planctomycetota bacterium]
MMKEQIATSAFASVFLVFFGLAILGKNQSFGKGEESQAKIRVSGQAILRVDQKPLPYITVRFTRRVDGKKTKVVKTTYADKNGKFIVEEVVENGFRGRILIEHENCQTEVIEVKAGDERKIGRFSVRPTIRYEKCSNHSAAQEVECVPCKGTGERLGSGGPQSTECKVCSGRGKVLRGCENCDGTGKIKVSLEVKRRKGLPKK